MEDLFVPTNLGRVHCRATGNGPVLFLMHSAGRSAYEFDALAALLADRFHVISWDMPGHGDSDRPRGHVSIAEFAETAVDLALRLSTGKPIMGGGSIGAAVALAAAAAHPDTIAGVLPIELPLGRAGAWWVQNWPMIETMFSFPDESEEHTRSRFRTLTPELAQRLKIDRHKAGSHGMMQLLWAGREDADATPGRLAALRPPALFINGDKGVAPEAEELLPRLNPAARLMVVKDSGHFPHTDDPTAVADAIKTGFPGA